MVMYFVNVFIEGAVMQKPMDPIEIKVLYHQEDHHLPGDGPPRRDAVVGSNHPDGTKAVMGEKYDRKFDYKVKKHQTLEAPPLKGPVVALRGLYFIFL